MKIQHQKMRGGIVKQIMKDHFEGFWYMNSFKYPEQLKKYVWAGYEV